MLYKNHKIITRWISFENKNAEKGKGGKENKGAKGHAFERLRIGETKILMDYAGEGTINRIWLTISNRRPAILQSVLLRCYWDNAEKPAVEVPLGDFFCANLGLVKPFENELFANPEGRSFISYVPMPFSKNAKITLTNLSNIELSLFYDINFSLQKLDDDFLYFHAWYNQCQNPLGEDYEILSLVYGSGRFLGASFGLITNPIYKSTWFGEGEVKVYLDDDNTYPTLVGTGLEDYLGTAWGQGLFINRYQGSLINDPEQGKYVFYRFHIKDPIYFAKNIKVTIQQIGGAQEKVLRELEENNVEIRRISVDKGSSFVRLLDGETTEIIDNNWVNFYRSDNYSSVAYFYLDKPENHLPTILSNINQ